MPSSWVDDKMHEVIEVEYGGVKVAFEPGERATGLIALQMLLQAGLVLPESSSPPSTATATSSPPSAPNVPAVLPSSPTSPTSPTSPRIGGGGGRDLEILDHGCSLGSCTHLLAELDQAGLVILQPGGKLILTAVETPEDFRHLQSRGLEEKTKRYGWENVRVLKGQMQVSFIDILCA